MDKRQRGEIGSEFAYSTAFTAEQPTVDCDAAVLTYSGRTALYIALRDLLSERAVETAWLPSYCCASMIQPFADSGMEVVFYNTAYREGSLARERFSPSKNDVVLTMAYFGFADSGNDTVLAHCADNGIAVIEDCTHSLLSQHAASAANYRIASLRKWFPIACGGMVKKKGGRLSAMYLQAPDPLVIRQRKTAMRDKAAYLQSGGTDAQKQAYLDAYRLFNKSFEEHIADWTIDTWSRELVMRQDIEAIRRQRRDNAAVLLQGIHDLKLESVYTHLDERDCPLFVPIVTPHAKRLQAYLAKQRIYCPMHWPRPCDEAVSDLYGQELSLICDQRYTPQDVVYILDVLERFCKEV